MAESKSSPLPTFLGGPSTPPIRTERPREPLPATMTPEYGKQQAAEVQRVVREQLDSANKKG